MKPISDIINGLWVSALIIGLGVYMINIQYDNYRISNDTELTVFNIKDIEKNGIGTSRYLQIEEVNFVAYAYSGYEGSSITYAYPVCSIDRALEMESGSKYTKINVVAISNGPYDTNNTTITGTALIGLDEISESIQKLIKSLDLKLSSQLIVLELDSTPEDKEFSILLLLLGIFIFIIGLFAIYGSFISNKDEN